MNYNEIIKIIKEKNIRKILVFGPPRSGTTLASFAFCKDTDLKLVPEDIATGMNESLSIDFIINTESVFHANSAIFYFHKIKDPTVIKIMLSRKEEDILLSAKKFGILDIINDIYNHIGKSDNYVKNFYEFWDLHKDVNSYLLDYESLKTTKYWLSEKDREGFGIKQVTKEKAIILEEFEEGYFKKNFKYLTEENKEEMRRLLC